MNFKVIILIVLIAYKGYGQVLDSALYQLEQISNDTERVNQIYKVGFDLRNTNPEVSMQYATVCEQFAKQTKSAKHLAKSYNLLGILYYKKGNYTQALQLQKKALALNISVNYSYGTAINNTNLGNIYSDLHEYALSESSYLQALQAYNQLNNTLHITKSLINIGVLKYEQKKLDAAVRQFKQALVFAKELNDKDLIASCDNNIGTIYRELGQLDSALFFLEEAIKLRLSINNTVELADSYNNIAIVWIYKNNFKEAVNYIELTDTICKKYDYKEGLVELYDTKAIYFEAQKNYEQALYWTKKHTFLKDSLQQIEKEESLINVDTANLVNEKTYKPAFKNGWILVFLSLLLIGIPLTLMRNKR